MSASAGRCVVRRYRSNGLGSVVGSKSVRLRLPRSCVSTPGPPPAAPGAWAPAPWLMPGHNTGRRKLPKCLQKIRIGLTWRFEGDCGARGACHSLSVTLLYIHGSGPGLV